MERNEIRRRRRRDRWAQAGVVVLAALVGLIAGLLAPNRSTEPPSGAPVTTSTTNPTNFPTP